MTDLLHLLDLAGTVAFALGAALCLFLRLMALYRGWRLPTAARFRSDTPSSD